MIEKGWTKSEIDEMSAKDLKYWYVETLNRHNREVKRHNEANGG